nr:acyl-CoA desaturase [Kibdelosporangium sp. MJ126-NF4]CEL14322.1 Fatty acid desaturase [Kibdelosporangium sp. MJ126-NF4]CTQ88689.1 Fatty acid desaturase (EC 1.14.19.3) [Kibdelosporangium sp. MJ126-NF4]
MTDPAQVTVEKRGSDFSELARRVRREGLLRRRIGYYAVRIGVNVAMLAVGVAAFVMLGDSWWQLFTAAYLALVFTQFAFIGHDAGHRQIMTTRRGNDIIGYIHSATVGISYEWWVGKHTRHHTSPNHEGVDPDIDIPALAFNVEQAEVKTGVFRWITKYQALLFLPLLMTQAIMLKVAGIDAVIRRDVENVRREALIMIGHVVIYLAAVFVVLSPGLGALFILVHQGLMGIYLGMSFAPNHKGMPIIAAEEKIDFLRRQVLTSRNIAGTKFVDYMLGGLNYQIEHHLFPAMPRANLRRAQPIIRGFCAEREIPYTSCSALESYLWVLRHLHEVGEGLRRPTQARLAN